MQDLSNYPTTRAPLSSILQKITEIRDSLSSINTELTILSYTTEGIAGFTFRLSQVLSFNIASLDKLIDTLNEPEKEVKSIRNDFGIFTYMTLVEKAKYEEISSLRHQVISQWRIIEDRKHELLRAIRDRLQLNNNL